MHLVKLLLLGWFAFGVITTFGFIWLCKRSSRRLEISRKKALAFDLHTDPAASRVVRSQAA